jgi:flagellar basal-body rod modification protein FlgD
MPVSGVSSASGSDAAARTTGSALDKDAFLSILVMQLQNQDPLSPMDNTDFIAQMAQFSALEQMQHLNTNFAMSQGANLIGKYVYAEIEGEDGIRTPVFGRVSASGMSDGDVYLHIGSANVPLGDVLEVYEGDAESDQRTQSVLQSSNLIGKHITAKVTGDGAAVDVEGIVGGIAVRDGVIYVTVGEREVNVADITGIQAA